MTPLPLSTPEDSESPPPSQGGDRPERSRNAKAQARHRAKRKAYIEQLEQTVTKLQYALSLSPDQVAVLPPPIVRIRELEEQNKELLRQIDEMQAQLADRQRGGGGGGSGHGHSLRPAAHPHRSSSGPVLPSFDDRGDHDTAKRRRTVEGPGDLSLMARPSQSPLQVAIPREYLPYPPHHSPATPMLPAPYTLQYQFPEPHQQQQQQQQQQHQQQQHASATSSPSAASFSSDGAYSPQMHEHTHAHAHAYAHEQHARAQQQQHPASPSYPAVLHPYARAAPPSQQSQSQPHQYEQAVKIEEDAYPVAAQNMYGSALAAYGGNSALGNWHGYGDGA